MKRAVTIAVFAVTLSASVGGDAAQSPAAPISVPDGWEEIPDMAQRASASVVEAGAARASVTARAWGDRSAGVFALYLSVPAGSADDRQTHGRLRDAEMAAGSEVTDWQYADGVSRHQFARGPFRGMTAVVTERGDGDDKLVAAALTCFHNDRSPTTSKATCEQLINEFAAR